MRVKKYRGIIFYNGCEKGTEVRVRKYRWMINALILHYTDTIEIIPYHSFTKAIFQKAHFEIYNIKENQDAGN